MPPHAHHRAPRAAHASALTIALVAALAAGCASPTTPTTDAPAADATLDAAAPPDVPARDTALPDRQPIRPPPIPRTDDDATLAPRRAACAFNAGAWPAETLGRDVPIGDEIPIDHVLVLMQENRSFDHYFSRLRALGHAEVDVPEENWSNPSPTGTPVARYHDTELCVEDPDHGWVAVHDQWNNGAMDGFVRSNEPDGRRAMGYMTEADIPFYYELAQTFAIGDRYFCSLLGPTAPNRLYLMAGTSFGYGTTALVTQDTRDHPVVNLFARMDDALIDWREYSGGLRSIGYFSYYGLFRSQTRAHFASLDDLMRDLAAGTLPPFALVEPSYAGNGGERYDEHPPGMPQQGEAFVERIVRAVMSSPRWSRIALFITYDEHGGFADHVAPPAACPPDALPPVDRNGQPLSGGGFDRLGVRVPFFVVSPYARRHFVSHRVYDHSSITRFIEARFGLPAMTARDANATIPTDMFDFASPPFMTPPTLAAHATIPAGARERCAQRFPESGGL